MLPIPEWMSEFVGKTIATVTNTETGVKYFWGYIACPNEDWSRLESHFQTVRALYQVVENPIVELINVGVYPQYTPEYFDGDYTIVKVLPPIEWIDA